MTTLHADSPRTDVHARDAEGGSLMRTLDVAALVLLVVGGLNWGLVGLFQFDLVATLFGEMSTLSRVVYALVGVAALYGLVTISRLLRRPA